MSEKWSELSIKEKAKRIHTLAGKLELYKQDNDRLRTENERLREAAVAMITGYYAELNFLDIEEKAPLLLVKGYVDALSQALEDK